jgi:hypothetical protein
MLISVDRLIAGVTLIISTIAAWYSARAFFLKRGIRIQGSYTIATSISCSDKYVSDITLYNVKDRAIVVFKIILQLGYGFYIELDNYENEPLILQPFEAWHRKYDPIDMYTMNLGRIDLKELMNSAKVRSRLILSTAEGKYEVRSWIRTWDPDEVFFRNYATSIVQARRSTFEGSAYGSNARFVVELSRTDGQRSFIPIYPSDISIRKFRHFRLTPESIQSRQRLEEFLLEQAIAGLLPCRDLAVHDLELLRAEAYDESKRPTVSARPLTWFQYHVAGRIATWLENRRLRRLNKARHQQALAQSKQSYRE